MATWYDVAERFASAARSIRVIAPPSRNWSLPIERSLFEYASSARLDRRYLVPSPTTMDSAEEGFLRDLHRMGWQVMWIDAPRSLLGILIDDDVAFVTAGAGRAFRIDQLDIVRGLVAHFDQTWRTGASNRGVRIVYDDVLVTAGPQPAATIQLATQEQWNRILRELASGSDDIYRLEPRRFEELVAELIQRDRPGRIIQLTPAAKDGGRDILVFDDTDVGRHLFLVECKRYAPDHPVDVGLVRQFFGVIEGERATAGALVTTSYFTAPARAWPIDKSLNYRLSLRDFDDLSSWVRKHAPKF